MLTIGVMSDTHLRCALQHADFLEMLDNTVFLDADIVVHAGDLVDQSILHAFAPRPVYAVRGNMDPASTGLPDRLVFEAGGCRFGVIHGWGAAEGLDQRVLSEFSATDLDCLVYGHSHLPDCRRVNGLLLFNPGSATRPRGGFGPSVGLLELNDAGIRGRILPLAGSR